MRSSPPGRTYRVRGGSIFSLNPIWIIIGINLLLFIATTIRQELIYYLGLVPAYFLSQPWTVVTSMFLHGSFWHIFANMFTLYFFGSSLSRLVGDGKFLLVYFVGGIVGNVLYILLGEPFSIAVGASGAVFAVAGALTMMAPRLKVIIFPLPVPVPLWVAVLGGFLLLSFMPHIAWQAHLGGLLVGLIAGYFFKRKLRHFIFV